MLAQESGRLRFDIQGPIDRGICAAAIGAKRDKIGVVALRGQERAQPLRRLEMFRVGHLEHQAAHALQHVDGRIMSPRRQFTRNANGNRERYQVTDFPECFEK